MIYRCIFVLLVFHGKWCLSEPVSGKRPTVAQKEERSYGGPYTSAYANPQSENALPTDSQAKFLDPWASPVPENLRVNEVPVFSPPTVGNSRSTSPTANKFTIQVTCGVDEMGVRLDFQRPFDGVVYSKGYFNKRSCAYIAGNSHRTSFNFSIGYDKCGSYIREAQAPVSSFEPEQTTTIRSTTTSTFVPKVQDSQREQKIVNNVIEKEETYEEWLARKYASMTTTTSTTTTETPLPTTVPSIAPTPAQALPYPSTFQQMGYPAQMGPQRMQIPGMGFVSPYTNQLAQQPTGYGSSYGPGYGNGMAVPQNLLPTALSNFGNVPLEQQTFSPTNPQYPTYLQNNLASYPYSSNLGYGRMGRSMEGDTPVADMQWVENTVIIQYDKDLQDVLDEAKSLQCEWKKSYSSERKVQQKFHIDSAEVVRAKFVGDSVGAYMQIRNGLGPLAPEAKGVIKIGNPLTLVIALTDSDNKFDLFVHSCTAKGSGRAPPIQLVDVNGCIVRDKYMGPFIPFYDATSAFGVNRVAFSYFQAFKFPDSSDLSIDCTVTVCRNACPRQCFGKYTTDAETLVKQWNKTETARSLGGEKIHTVGKANAGRDQRMLMDILEKKMAAANGPQRLEINVQAKAPGITSPTKFLQLRMMDDDLPDNTNQTVPVSNSTRRDSNSTLPTSHKVKRDVEEEKTDVDLKKKITVIYPKDIEGLDENHLLPMLGFQPRLLKNFENVISPTTSSPLSKPADLTSSTTTSSILNSSSTAPKETVTATPSFYAIQDHNQHICIPLMGMILGGGGCVLILFMAILSSFCVCCSMKKKEKKFKQSYPMYSEPRSVAIKAFPTTGSKLTLL